MNLLKKATKILTLFICAVLIVSFFTSCFHSHEYGDWQIVKKATCMEVGYQSKFCDCGKTITQEIEVTAHSWKEATFSEPKTCKECQVTEGTAIDAFSWLKDFVVNNGEYTRGDYGTSGDYDLLLGSFGGVQTYIGYDTSNKDELILYYYGCTESSYGFLFGINIDSSLSGVYDWSALDTYDDYISGTLIARYFDSNQSRLTCDYSDFPSSMKTSAEELCASSLNNLLITFNVYFEEYGLSSADIGFTKIH